MPAPTPPRTRKRLRDQQWLVALAFVAPGAVALVLLRVVPAVDAFLDSLQRTSVLKQTTSWVGLQNYLDLLQDPGFRQTVKVTAIFSLVVNPIQILIALLIALLLHKTLPGGRVWRAFVFIPVAVPAAVSTIIWGIAFQPNGLINAFLDVVGIGRQPFLTSPQQAMWSVLVMLSWIGVGYWMIFLIAGLQDIPASYYEAAKVDGAGTWRTFVNITLPLLRRPLAFVLVADTVSNFLVFAPIQILTNGGPENTTRLVMFDIYNKAYQVGDVNLAQAEVVLLVLVMAAIVSVQFWLLNRRGVD